MKSIQILVLLTFALILNSCALHEEKRFTGVHDIQLNETEYAAITALDSAIDNNCYENGKADYLNKTSAMYGIESSYFLKNRIKNEYIDRLLVSNEYEALDVFLLYQYSMIIEDDIDDKIFLLEKSLEMSQELSSVYTVPISADLAGLYHKIGDNSAAIEFLEYSIDSYIAGIRNGYGDQKEYYNITRIIGIILNSHNMEYDYDGLIRSKYDSNDAEAQKALDLLRWLELHASEYEPIWVPDSSLTINKKVLRNKLEEFERSIIDR